MTARGPETPSWLTLGSLSFDLKTALLSKYPCDISWMYIVQPNTSQMSHLNLVLVLVAGCWFAWCLLHCKRNIAFTLNCLLCSVHCTVLTASTSEHLKQCTLQAVLWGQDERKAKGEPHLKTSCIAHLALHCKKSHTYIEFSENVTPGMSFRVCELLETIGSIECEIFRCASISWFQVVSK